MGARRVLVVDDYEDACELLVAMLGLAGYDAHAAVCAFDALTKATELRPEILIIDIGLPEMDGFDLTLLLRRQPELEGCRFIAVTGYSGPETEARCKAVGFEACLIKPVNFDSLLAMIATEPKPQTPGMASAI